MRSLLIMATAAAAILVCGCREKKREPVPGPQATLTERTTANASRANTVTPDCPAPRHRVGEICWFQGTLDTAFSARSSKESHRLFRG